MPVNKAFTKLGVKLLQIHAHPVVFFYRLTCLWGGFLLMPFSSFSGNGFYIMRSIAPKEVWGAIIFFVGIRLCSATKSNKIRKIRDALFGLVITWLFITLMICIASPQTTAVVVYPFITFYIIREYLIYSIRYSVLKQELDATALTN